MSTSRVNGIGPPTRVGHRRHPPHLPAPLHRERAAEEPRERAVRQLRPPLLRPRPVQQQRVVELGERGDPAHQEPAPAEPPAEGPQPSGAVGSSCARRSGARPPPSRVPRHHLGATALAVASLARDEHVGATPVPRAVAPPRATARGCCCSKQRGTPSLIRLLSRSPPADPGASLCRPTRGWPHPRAPPACPAPAPLRRRTRRGGGSRTLTVRPRVPAPRGGPAAPPSPRSRGCSRAGSG